MHTKRWRLAGAITSSAFLLLLTVNSLATSTIATETSANTVAASEQSYWREWWLVKILADKKEFAEFAALRVEDQDYALASQPEQQEWLRKWWHSRDPDLTTEKNEWREHIDSLADFADFRYPQPRQTSENNPPWDERGQYFIKLGPPDSEESAKKLLKITPSDDPKINKKMNEFFHAEVADLEQKQRGSAEAVVWTWYPRSGRNDRIIKVQFQPDNTMEYVAVPVVEDGAGRDGGIYQSDLTEGADAISRVLSSPAAEYVADDREPIPFSIEGIRFHHQADSTDLWVAFAIPLRGLKECQGERKASSKFTVDAERPIFAADNERQKDYAGLSKQTTYRVDPVMIGDGNMATQVERFTLTDNSYTVGFKIDDLCDINRGITGKMKTEIVRYDAPETQKKVSDVMLLAAAPEEAPSFDDQFTRVLNGHHIVLTPLPTHVFERTSDSIRVYHEAYNLYQEADKGCKVLLTYLLYRDKKGWSQRPDTLTVRSVTSPYSMLGFYQAIPMTEVPKGEYILAIQTFDLYDPANLDMSTTRWAATRFKVK